MPVRKDASESSYRRYSYNYLLMAVQKAEARVKALKSEEPHPHPFSDCLAMLVFSAMAFEAFINHLGQIVDPNWKAMERAPPRDKADHVAHKCGKKLVWGKRPYQSVRELLRFRNIVAHANSILVPTSSMHGKPSLKFNNWPSYCESEISLRLVGDLRRVIADLPGTLGVEVVPAFLLAESVVPGALWRQPVDVSAGDV